MTDDLPIVAELMGLHKQATEERSHYYVGSRCLRAAALIREQHAALVKCHRVLKYQPTVAWHCEALEVVCAALARAAEEEPK